MFDDQNEVGDTFERVSRKEKNRYMVLEEGENGGYSNT